MPTSQLSLHLFRILQFLGDAQLNLSTDTAIAQVKQFLRVMAQPVDQNVLKEVLLTVEEVEEVEIMSPPSNTNFHIVES